MDEKNTLARLSHHPPLALSMKMKKDPGPRAPLPASPPLFPHPSEAISACLNVVVVCIVLQEAALRFRSSVVMVKR